MDRAIMEYLAKAEGKKLHRIPGEEDVTSPYGIYRKIHPKASIWLYIDTVANQMGISGDSSTWEQEDIDAINMVLYDDELYQLASDFYDEYLKGAHLDLFMLECRVTVMSLYVNSPWRLWKAVQEAVNSLREEGRVQCDRLVVDGVYGPKTRECVLNVTKRGIPLRQRILLAMYRLYIELWHSNKEKYSDVLMGWANRLNKLNRTAI